MTLTKCSPEQIVAKLREHEKLQGQGLTIPQAWLVGVVAVDSIRRADARNL